MVQACCGVFAIPVNPFTLCLTLVHPFSSNIQKRSNGYGKNRERDGETERERERERKGNGKADLRSSRGSKRVGRRDTRRRIKRHRTYRCGELRIGVSVKSLTAAKRSFHGLPNITIPSFSQSIRIFATSGK